MENTIILIAAILALITACVDFAGVYLESKNQDKPLRVRFFSLKKKKH
ncbi:hypothetical protein [Paenibacillus sp. 1A_MP2]